MTDIEENFLRQPTFKTNQDPMAWKTSAGLSAFYLVIFTIQLFLYEKGQAPVEACASLDFWVWLMNLYFLACLLLNAILTIYQKYSSSVNESVVSIM